MLYAITPDFENEHDLLQIIFLIQKYPVSHFILRNKNLTLEEFYKYRDLAVKNLPSNVTVIINPRKISHQNIQAEALIHLNSQNLFKASESKNWVSASCHNIKEISAANKLNLEFIFLSPVLKTLNYPRYLGWKKFAELAKESKHPVIALGGLKIDSMQEALTHGAKGIAGISMFSS